VLDEQALDVQAGEEFAREVLSRIPLESVDDLLDELEGKSRRFRAELAPDRLAALDREGACALLRATPGVRRRAEEVLRGVGVEGLRRLWAELLYGQGPVEDRFSAFCEALAPACPREEFIDVGGEALHWVFPDRYWLWTRWMWNPRTQTGALRFVVPDWRALSAPSLGQVYRKVGEAVAYAEAARESLGLFSHVRRRRSPFLNDVHLAVVYTLYLFTTLRMRMTKEFTRVLPPPWELVRRLLGVYPGEGENAENRA